MGRRAGKTSGGAFDVIKIKSEARVGNNPCQREVRRRGTLCSFPFTFRLILKASEREIPFTLNNLMCTREGEKH